MAEVASKRRSLVGILLLPVLILEPVPRKCFIRSFIQAQNREKASATISFEPS
jgi:hypothetical protein